MAGLHPSRLVLPNGVTVITRETRKTPAVTIALALRAGAVVDPPDAPGAMHLLSRVIDRGTTTRSEADIADTLDGRGISLSVSVSRHLFSLVCTCLAVDFEQVLSLLADIVIHPSLPEHELATRRAQVVTSLRQDEDNPAVRAVETCMALLYGDDHPYGRRVKGTIASIDAISRDQLVALHAARFAPDQLSVVIVGDVGNAQVADGAARTFGEWQTPPPARVSLAPAPVQTARRVVVVPMMNKSQADIAYGFTSVARSDPGYYAFALMNNILGQYAMGGRLGDSIRERQGMAYYVSSGFDASVIAGPLMVRAGVAAANVERAIASIDAELDNIRRNGVTGRELAESRQYLVGSMPRALETNEGIASFLQSAEFHGLGPDHDERLPGLLTACTIDEVNAAASALDPAKATVVVAGPYRQP